MSRRRTFAYVVLVLGALVLPAALAQERPPQQLLVVNADEIVLDATGWLLTASGKVRLSGEDLLLTCGQLQATVDQKTQQIAQVEASGDVQFQMRYRQQEQDWQVSAVAQRAQFLPQQRLLLAQGSAVVEVKAGEPGQQQYRLSGDSVQFDLDKRRLLARKEEHQPEMEITLPPPQQEAQ